MKHARLAALSLLALIATVAVAHPTPVPAWPQDAGSGAAASGGKDPKKELSLPNPPDQAAAATSTDRPSARDAAQKVLDDKGWTEGYDTTKGWGIWIGSAPISGGDLDDRVAALDEAMLNAKWEFAQYLGAKIASASQKLFEKNPAERAAQMADLKKRAAAGDHNAQDMYNALEAAGDDGPKPGESKPANTQWHKRMENASATVAQNAVSGMIVYQSFERAGSGTDDGEIAVIMMTTPKTRAVADALLGRPNPAMLRGEKKDPIAAWVKAMPSSELAYTFGAKTRLNEKGELCVVGFGHAVTDGSDRESEEIAAIEAAKMADDVIRNLAGSMIQGVVAISKITDKTKLADGSVRSENKSSMKQKIAEAANWLTVRGASPIGAPRVLKDNPRYTDVVVVKEWNVSAALKAGELAKALEQAGGYKGGDGLGAGGQGGGDTPAQKPKRGSGAVSGDGRSSDDDDQ